MRDEVGDSGPGIDQDFFPKIFDPFFTTKENGVGMGLSIAHKDSRPARRDTVRRECRTR